MISIDATDADIRRACDADRWHDAVTFAVHTYGDELHGYLIAMTRDASSADEAFSILCERIWKDLPRFRWECSFRTWAYLLARQSLGRVRRDPYRRRAVDIEDAGIARIVADHHSRTATFMRTETRDKLARLRSELTPDDQTLLVLRINRKLAWQDIARVLGDEADDAAVLTRRSAALRKRFERLKCELRARITERREHA
jgi:RNA polymerase sigma-70 factor (ECF subfamily)